MSKEKRNNLAIYTLAGSILISSVLVSMNQGNAHDTDTREIRRVKTDLESKIRRVESDLSRFKLCANGNFQNPNSARGCP